MMWCGRMVFLLKGGAASECIAFEGPLITEHDARMYSDSRLIIGDRLRPSAFQGP